MVRTYRQIHPDNTAYTRDDLKVVINEVKTGHITKYNGKLAMTFFLTSLMQLATREG